LLFVSTYVPVAMVFQPPIKFICTLFSGGSEGGRLKLTFHFHPALTLCFCGVYQIFLTVPYNVALSLWQVCRNSSCKFC